MMMDFNRSVLRPPLPQLGFEENDNELHFMMGWNLTPEDLIHIPEHWLSYPEVRSFYHYVLAFTYTILFSLGFIGNGLVLWIFCLSKSLRTPSNLFVLNLALCDFSMVLVLPILINNSIDHKYPGHLQCQIFALCGSISGIGAGATNAAIAYDRYSTIAKPFEGRMTYGKATFMIICIWMYVFPWCYLPLSEQWNRFVPEGFLTSCSFDYLTKTEETKTFVGVMFIICYVIPMSFIIYFYSQIVCHVFKHEKILRDQAKKMNIESLRSNQDANAQSAEVRIAKAAITICCLFIVAWTPYAVVAMIGAFGDQSLLSPVITMLPAVFAKTVACFDPYVYAISHPKYRLELSKRIPGLGITEKSSASSADTQSMTTTA